MASGIRILAHGVHAYTASGLVFNALAMMEVWKAQPDPRWVFGWLLAAAFVDMTDGTFARRFDVKKNAATYDGRKIDDIVDFLTFTFVPLMLVIRMGWVPEPALAFVGPAMIASVMGFCNVSAKMEEDGYFMGFPSYWNVVAFYCGYFANVWVNAAMMVFLTILTFVPVGFIYPTMAPPKWKKFMILVLALLTVVPLGFMYPTQAPLKWRKFMVLGGYAWCLWCLGMLPTYPNTPVWAVALSLCGPVFYGLISVVEFAKLKRGTPAPADAALP
jgi:phosphatidylcholine synthase